MSNNKLKETEKLALSTDEFFDFYKKFIGKFIYRGNKSLAVRRSDLVFYLLKQQSSTSPLLPFMKAVSYLLPIFAHSVKKLGKKIYYVPTFNYSNKRFILIFDWIIKKLKNKTNVRGLKITHFVPYLIQASENTGVLLRTKRDYYKQLFRNRHLMSKRLKKGKLIHVSKISD